MTHLQWARLRRLGLVALGLTMGACADSAAPIRPDAEPPAFDGPTLYRGLMLGSGPAADFLSNQGGTPRLIDLVNDPAQLSHITRLQDRLIAAVDSINPGFLTTFARAMTSGDHSRIQAMYAQAAEVTARTLLTLDEVRRVKGALADRRAVDAAVTRRLNELGRNEPEAKAAVQQAIEALYAASEAGSGPRPMFMKKQPDGGGGGGGGGASIVYTLVAAVYYVVAVDVAVVSNAALAISIYVTLAVTGPNALAPMTDLGRERLVHAVAENFASAVRPERSQLRQLALSQR